MFKAGCSVWVSTSFIYGTLRLVRMNLYSSERRVRFFLIPLLGHIIARETRVGIYYTTLQMMMILLHTTLQMIAILVSLPAFCTSDLLVEEQCKDHRDELKQIKKTFITLIITIRRRTILKQLSHTCAALLIARTRRTRTRERDVTLQVMTW